MLLWILGFPGILLLFSFQLSGQMFPLSDNYRDNALAINPAFAGCHDALSATIAYRNQWVGFDDAPKSQILSVHTPVDNNRIGLGLLIENNTIGIFRETNYLGNYAYRRELYDGTLALGLGFGITVYNIAWNELYAEDDGDLQLINNPTTAVIPAFSLGTYYYTKTYYIGISLPLFLSHEQDQATGKYKIRNDFSAYNYIFSGGYEVGISQLIKFIPSLLLKYHPASGIQVDINAQMDLKERIRIGLGYRNKEMLIGMLQCQLNHQLRMSYSYDFDFGSIGKYRNGSHEITFNYVFSFVRRVMGPRQF